MYLKVVVYMFDNKQKEMVSKKIPIMGNKILDLR